MSNKTIFLKQPIMVNNTEHPEILTVKFTLSQDAKSKYFLKDELLQHLARFQLMGVKLCVLDSLDMYSLQDSLVKILPDIRLMFPVRLNLDYKSTSLVFLKNIKSMVDGFYLDIKIPFKNLYAEEEKQRFTEMICMDTDRDIYQYRNNMLNVIQLIDDMKLTIYKTNINNKLNDEDIEYMLKFSKYLQGDYFLNNESNN